MASVGHHIPFPVDQVIRPMHLCRQINVGLHQCVVPCTMIVRPINPCGLPGLDPGRVFQLASLSHIRHQRRFHHVGQGSHDEHPPRRRPHTGNRKFTVHRAYLVSMASRSGPVTQERAAMGSSQSGFRDEQKTPLCRFEQGRIAPLARFLPVCLQRKEAFVAHHVGLHPSVRAVGHLVSRIFSRETFLWPCLQQITEGHPVVIHAQRQFQFFSRTVVQNKGALMGMIHAMETFTGAHAVIIRMRTQGRDLVQSERSAPVAQIGSQTNPDMMQQHLSPASHGQARFAVGRTGQFHMKPSGRRQNGAALRPKPGRKRHDTKQHTRHGKKTINPIHEMKRFEKVHISTKIIVSSLSHIAQYLPGLGLYLLFLF